MEDIDPMGGPRVTEDTQQAIAEDLGVSEGLVSEVANDPDVKDVTRNELNTDEKREQVREFVEESVHIIRSNTLNIPSEREQVRGGAREVYSHY
jgi:hypothetical protein